MYLYVFVSYTNIYRCMPKILSHHLRRWWTSVGTEEKPQKLEILCLVWLRNDTEDLIPLPTVVPLKWPSNWQCFVKHLFFQVDIHTCLYHAGRASQDMWRPTDPFLPLPWVNYLLITVFVVSWSSPGSISWTLCELTSHRTKICHQA